MCGIVGVVGAADASQILVEGLKRLEYRGYDSAGIASLTGGRIERRRAVGKLSALSALLAGNPLPGGIGIGHTRWATHGAPTEDNAHPHASDKVAVVHNGIIENYDTLKAELVARGHVFASETDTEAVVHLVTDLLDQGLPPRAAAAAAFSRLHGAYSLVLLFAGEPDLLIATRRGTPLAIGHGDGTMFVASDALALAPLTRRLTYLADGDRAEVSAAGVTLFDDSGAPVTRPERLSNVTGALIGKGNHRHFMQKEIHEQPAVIGDTLNTFIHPSTGRIALPELPFDLAAAPRLTIVACGTAYYAGLVGKYWFEQIARLPVEIDVASEFRYREAPMPDGGVTIAVSQSGETMDTLEALRYAKREGQATLGIVNVPESTIARECDATLLTQAGPEICVASTKATTTQLSVLACLALGVAEARGTITPARAAELGQQLREIPSLVAEVLKHEETIETIAHDIAKARDVLYMARGNLYPVALEGALKLKEISYIHAEGYAAGEMKHGPIALIDENVPVIFIAPTGPLFDKLAANVSEVAARGGKVLLISDRAGLDRLAGKTRWQIEIPPVDPAVAPILAAIPVQLLAYHVAVLKGTDVDQPRNLAKSVTVE